MEFIVLQVIPNRLRYSLNSVAKLHISISILTYLYSLSEIPFNLKTVQLQFFLSNLILMDATVGFNKETNSANPLNKYSHYNVNKLRDLTINGYVRKMKSHYALSIPMDIVTVIIKFYPTFEWSRKLSHRNIVIKNNFIENSFSKNEWINAYDCQEFDSGIFEWTVKILKDGDTGTSGWNHWTIGVIDTSVKLKDNDYFAGYNRGKCVGFGYNSGGHFYHGSHYSYGTKYGVGDTITTVVDCDKLSISFILNGKELGIAREKLKADTKYRFVVASYCNGDSLTFLESRIE